MSDGQITFNTALDNSQLEKDLKDAEKEVNGLKRKLEKNDHDKGVIAEQMEQAQKEIEKTEQKIINLGERLKELEELSATDPAGAAGRAEAVTEELVEQAKIYDRQLADSEKLAGRWNKLDVEARQYAKELDAARAKQAELGAEYARSYKQGSAAFAASMATMEGRFNAFTSKISKRMKKLFVFSFIFGALASLKKHIMSTVGENDRLVASVENLKAIMRGFAAPAIATLANVLTSIVNVISTVLMTLARMVDSIFHTNIVQSIQQAQQAARASWNAADAADNQAKATNRLAKAQKEAARWLAAFDELNVMQAKDDEDISDAMDDVAGATAKPDWNALDVGKIDERLSAIMVLLGAALMAVGAILAFSGINIPLGLTLMAIGALMVYSAVSENWDKLPREVKDAINAALVVTGIVLVVLGAVLAFSGANIPLGIGMMLAGAVLLATAAALNWDTLPSSVRGVVSALMILLGGALLAVGAILAVSGANIPLGVGLMAAGAVALAAVAALNWGKLSTEVKGVVLAIATALSAALIVVGAVLVFSGAYLPLGIGLMAAGAIGLAASAKIAWDQLPAKTRRQVAEIAGIVGKALLVVGAILAISGANLPLGIGLLVAGAALLGTSAALNWDKMPDNIDAIVKKIGDIVGKALLVVGAILAISGANVVLGLSLLALGAVTLGATRSVNWNNVKDNVDSTVKEIGKIVGAALLALGAVLALSGVAIPLGLALMAMGAVVLATTMLVDWNNVKDDVEGTVTTIAAIVGYALLVLGVVLCFSGVAIPLGLALMAAGAVTLATMVAANWQKIPQETRDSLSTIMAIVGGFLLVLGVILCITGVGIPLGIGLIIAGAGSIAAAVAVNWHAIKDKAREVWSGLKEWFRNNVAPIFTAQWWKDKFMSIGKGLVSALSQAGSRFHGFITDVCKNIGGALSMLGQSWSYSIPSIYIPPLAKGAVIPPNREFLALLGDQTSGRNIEAPEDLIRQIVREEAGGVGAVALLGELVELTRQGRAIYVDRQVLGRAAKREFAAQTLMGGA